MVMKWLWFLQSRSKFFLFYLIWLSLSLLALIALLCCSKKFSSSSSPWVAGCIHQYIKDIDGSKATWDFVRFSLWFFKICNFLQVLFLWITQFLIFLEINSMHLYGMLLVFVIFVTSSERYCRVLPPLSESMSELIAIWQRLQIGYMSHVTHTI